MQLSNDSLTSLPSRGQGSSEEKALDTQPAKIGMLAMLLSDAMSRNKSLTSSALVPSSTER